VTEGLLTPAETAARLAVSGETLRLWRRAEVLPAVELPSTRGARPIVRYAEAAVAAFAEAHRRGGSLDNLRRRGMLALHDEPCAERGGAMAHVRRRKGREGWYGTYRDATGKIVERRVPGASRKAATTATLRLEYKAWERREGLEPVEADEEIDGLRAAWLATIRTHCRAPTVKDYECSLRLVLGWLGRRAVEDRRSLRTTGDLRLDDVRAYAAACMADGQTAATVEKKVATLHRMLRWGVAEGRILRDPLARWRRLAGPRRKTRRALTEWEIAKLLAASRQPYRDIWTLAVATGMRPGEFTQLEWGDLDLEGNALRVRGETSKSKRDRTLPLRGDLVRMLARMRLAAPASQRLVLVNTKGERWGNSLAAAFKRSARDAGLDRSLDLYHLRHTFGSHLIRAGVRPKTVQMLMGHSSLRITLDIYTHEIEEGDRRTAVELLPLPTANARPMAGHARAMGD